MRTTSPSSASLTLIWQERRELGRASAAKLSMLASEEPGTGTPVPGSQEASMLSFAALAQPNSRLSCQLKVSEALDGLIVRMPEGQH